jgi:hypothetical protein
MKKLIFFFMFVSNISFGQTYLFAIENAKHEDLKKDGSAKPKIEILFENKSILSISESKIILSYIYNGLKSSEYFELPDASHNFFKREDGFSIYEFENGFKGIFKKDILIIEKYKSGILIWRNTFKLKLLKVIYSA